eukprot:6190565-Pleurochrysis_carterae.AAC.1
MKVYELDGRDDMKECQDALEEIAGKRSVPQARCRTMMSVHWLRSMPQPHLQLAGILCCLQRAEMIMGADVLGILAD